MKLLGSREIFICLIIALLTLIKMPLTWVFVHSFQKFNTVPIKLNSKSLLHNSWYFYCLHVVIYFTHTNFLHLLSFHCINYLYKLWAVMEKCTNVPNPHLRWRPLAVQHQIVLLFIQLWLTLAEIFLFNLLIIIWSWFA